MCAVIPSQALATITFSPTGVSPTDPASWNSFTDGYVGDDTGAGTVTITTGGASSSLASQNGYIGYSSSGSGTISVGGSSSTWTNDNGLYVGYASTGLLDINSGGTVTAEKALAIGHHTSTLGTATVDGEGSLLVGPTQSSGPIFGGLPLSIEAPTLNVGLSGFGTLNITNGGAVTSANASLAVMPGSKGVATVTGAGSTWISSGDLSVGEGSDGELNISDGGSVTVAGATQVGCTPYNTCTVNFNNGTLTTGSFYASPSNASSALTGSGAINTRGLVSDVNLTFDSTHSPTAIQTYTNFGGVSGLTLNLDITNSGDVGDLGAGYYGNGSLLIQNGVAVNTAAGYLGYGVGSNGTATVEGSGSTWTNSADLYVAKDGSGTLNIQNGGVVSVAGTTYVGGAASQGIVAFSGTGGTLSTKSLSISPYATSQFTGTGTISAQGLSDGDKNLNLVFDDVSTTTMTLEGAVTLSLNLGDSDNAGDLGLGYTGSSTMMIQNGANVYSANCSLAHDNGSSATVTVTGAGSSWSNSGTIYVGSDFLVGGTATLNVTHGGVVSASRISQSFSMPGMGGPTGTVNFDGGTLRAIADEMSFMTGLTNAFVKQNGVTIDTNGHNIEIAQPFLTDTVSTGGGLTKIGDGTLTLWNASTYTGATTVMAGTLILSGVDTSTPSAWDNVFNLSGGGADIQAGKLIFDYTGSPPFSFGTSPASTVDGLLTASFSGGTASWTTGQFRCSNADASHGLGWLDDGTSQVTVMYTLYGDSNLDGSVNGTDLNAVLSYYNQSGEVWGHGDFNYDGSVNGTDLNTVLSNYNQSLSSSTAAVPEPSTLLLMVLGLAGLLAWRRK